jgi:hypothetical protein
MTQVTFTVDLDFEGPNLLLAAADVWTKIDTIGGDGKYRVTDCSIIRPSYQNYGIATTTVVPGTLK